MKNTIKLLGIIAFAAIIGFSFTSCGGGGTTSTTPGGTTPGAGSTEPNSVTYISKDATNTYVLDISRSASANISRAAFTPKQDDVFTLTIIVTQTGAIKGVTSGTVASTGASLTLTVMGGAELTVTVTGGGMTAIQVTTGTITLNDNTSFTGASGLEAAKSGVDDTFTLNVNWDRSAWDGTIALADITPYKPKKGDWLRFKVRGTTDKTLEKADFSVSTRNSDWSAFQWLGGAGKFKLSGTFEQTFTIEIKDDEDPAYPIFDFTFTNDVAVPASAKDWAVLATITNFEIMLLGVNLPDYTAYYGDWAVSANNMADAKKRTDFSFGYESWGKENTYEDTIIPFSKYLDGGASVKIVNGNVVINLGTPNPQALSSLVDFIQASSPSFWYSSGTFNYETSDDGEKLLKVSCSFRTSDGKYSLIGPADFIYANKANTKITRNNTYYDEHDNPIWTYSGTITLNKGWNYVWMDWDARKEFVSTTQPKGHWLVLEEGYYQ